MIWKWQQSLITALQHTVKLKHQRRTLWKTVNNVRRPTDVQRAPAHPFSIFLFTAGETADTLAALYCPTHLVFYTFNGRASTLIHYLRQMPFLMSLSQALICTASRVSITYCADPSSWGGIKTEEKHRGLSFRLDGGQFSEELVPPHSCPLLLLTVPG